MADDKRTPDDKFRTDDKHADEKHAGDKHHEDRKAGKEAEDLTPTPTQAEMDKIMSGLSDEDLARAKKPEARGARGGAETHDPTPESHPPHMTQAENDAAMALAAPGDASPDEEVPPEPEVPPIDEEGPPPIDGGELPPEEAKRRAAEARRKKDMEAQHPPGYQTRNVVPPRK